MEKIIYKHISIVKIILLLYYEPTDPRHVLIVTDNLNHNFQPQLSRDHLAIETQLSLSQNFSVLLRLMR